MDVELSKSLQTAMSFFKVANPPVRLGWGLSGFVYLSPDSRTAIKIFRNQDGFSRELAVYRRLQGLRITKLHGLTIPKLRGFQFESKIIRMDFVSPPYLLDFAGASLSPPDFSADVMQFHYAKIEEEFAPNSSIVHEVYTSLALHGIYYLDFRRSNLNLTGLPNLLPDPPSEES